MPDEQGNGQLVVEHEGTEDPVVAVRALQEPPPLDDALAPRAGRRHAGFPCSLMSMFLLSSLWTFMRSPHLEHLDVDGLKIVPDHFAACRALDGNHGSSLPFPCHELFMMRSICPLAHQKEIHR